MRKCGRYTSESKGSYSAHFSLVTSSTVLLLLEIPSFSVTSVTVQTEFGIGNSKP